MSAFRASGVKCGHREALEFLRSSVGSGTLAPAAPDGMTRRRHDDPGGGIQVRRCTELDTGASSIGWPGVRILGLSEVLSSHQADGRAFCAVKRSGGPTVHRTVGRSDDSAMWKLVFLMLRWSFFRPLRPLCKSCIKEQMLDFSQADIVVGVDGACFANILWMPAGGHTLVIVPSKRNYVPILPVKDFQRSALVHSRCCYTALCAAPPARLERPWRFAE